MKKHHDKILILFLIASSLFHLRVCFPQNSEENVQTAGKIVLSSAAMDFIVRESLVYVYTTYSSSNRLTIIDFSNPENPFKMGQCKLGNTGPHNIEGGDSHKADLCWPYFLYPMEDGIEIVDVTDPANPYKIAQYSFPEPDKQAGVICVHNNTALVSHARTSWLEILDLSNIENPRRLALLNLEEDPSTISRVEARQIMWNGDRYAYLNLGANDGMRVGGQQFAILNLANSTNPQIISRLPCDNAIFHGNKMIRSGNQFLFSYWEKYREYSGIIIIDASNPHSPVIHGPVLSEENIFYLYLYQSGFLTWVTNPKSGVLHYYRINEHVPVKTAEYRFPVLVSRNIVVAGDYWLSIGYYGASKYLYISKPQTNSEIPFFSLLK